ASVRDRRRGVIEAGPDIAPSLLEPWRPTESLGRRVEQTIAFERRRARFEFAPIEAEAEAEGEIEGDLEGPDVLGIEHPGVDRTRHGGPLRLRVRVYVEQAHVPGVRAGTWARGRLPRAKVIDPETGEPLPSFWTPVSRDRAFEQRLLGQIAVRYRDLAQDDTTPPDGG
ncbi:MAG: hypothetical protein GY715_19445, partial [Planctomycetes bacterium]|nr:hypothetical protein [Planctomycetota bacterium]